MPALRSSRRGLPRRARARLVAVAALAWALALPLASGGATAAELSPGEAPGGSRSDASGQHRADAENIAESCADNAVLLFTFRGSGAEYGVTSGERRDSLITWLDAAKTELIDRGYRVRELQAIYPAQPVPWPSLRPSSWWEYRDSILSTEDAVYNSLEAAVRRCPQRKVLIAAYSSGAVLAGRVIPRLTPQALSAIRSVDLIADPSAHAPSDRDMQTPRKLDGRRTRRGAYTATVITKPRVYPDGFRTRVSIYCRVPDPVCNLKSTVVIDLLAQLKHHSRYEWAKIGRRAARKLRARPRQTPATTAPSCRPASSVAVIVDDSGSMAGNDEANLRRRALELLLTKPSGLARTVGAVEFGDDAGPLFAPGLVAANATSMLGALAALDNDGYTDGGGTDYDAAFAASTAAQPGADARIFLTDGEHNAGVYANTHSGGPRTYVIGLNIGPAGRGDENAELLARIAAETGGRYFPLRESPFDDADTQAARLQPVFNTIDALLGCGDAPGQATQSFTAEGQRGPVLTSRFAGRRALEVVVTWSSDTARIDLASARVCDRRGRVIADLLGSKGSAKARGRGKGRGRRGKGRRRVRKIGKLRYGIVRGATFTTITVRRPKRGTTLRLRLKAGKLPTPQTVSVQPRPLWRVPPLQHVPAPPIAPPAPAPSPAPEPEPAPQPSTPQIPQPETTPRPSTPVPRPRTPQPPTTWAEQQGSRGANTFLNPYNASGMGPRIEPMTWVQVSCKVHAPQIASANPDGYWYRIASAPWNNQYYAVANTFWNGDVPGQRPYTHNTDWAVRDC